MMIKLAHVSKRFGAIAALRDINLEIAAGEFVLLSGPSGAGKSTLLRTIFAAERPDEGTVQIGERETTRLCRREVPELRRSLGVVFQDFKLLPGRSALQNVALALEIRGLPPTQVRDRSKLALAAVGLEARAQTAAGSLSGGEQQRVAIARALVGSPSVLLADEPTGNLDPERSHDILDLLSLEAKRGTTVVVATHDPMVVQTAAANRVLLMDGGSLVGSLAGAGAAVEPPRAAARRPAQPPVPSLLPAEAA